MPHTNITNQLQRVRTKQNPDKEQLVKPGDTINEEAITCVQVEDSQPPGEALEVIDLAEDQAEEDAAQT